MSKKNSKKKNTASTSNEKKVIKGERSDSKDIVVLASLEDIKKKNDEVKQRLLQIEAIQDKLQQIFMNKEKKRYFLQLFLNLVVAIQILKILLMQKIFYLILF